MRDSVARRVEHETHRSPPIPERRGDSLSGAVTAPPAASSDRRGRHRKPSPLSGPVADRLLVSGLAAAGVVLALLGVAERVWMVDHFPINSDQAVVGLVAKGILHGHFVAFLWGQHYAGVEPYVTSVLFALFGSSDTVLNFTPVVLSVSATCLVYVVGRSYVPRVFAALAALAVWVWPLISLTSSTEEGGYVLACLNLGLLAVLFATRIRLAGGRRPLNWAMLGLSVGGCDVVQPRGACISWCRACSRWARRRAEVGRTERRRRLQSRRRHGRDRTGWPALLVGHGGDALRHRHPSEHRALPGHPGHSGDVDDSATPSLSPWDCSARIPAHWFGPPTWPRPGWSSCFSSWPEPSPGPWSGTGLGRSWPLVAFVAAYLVIYPLLPPTFSWQDGRYIFFLPFLFIIVACIPLGRGAVASWRWGSGRLVVAAMACVTVLEIPAVFAGFSATAAGHALAVARGRPRALWPWPWRRRTSCGATPPIGSAYKLDFESDGALTYSPIPTDNLRNNAYLAAVDRRTSAGMDRLSAVRHRRLCQCHRLRGRQPGRAHMGVTDVVVHAPERSRTVRRRSKDSPSWSRPCASPRPFSRTQASWPSDRPGSVSTGSGSSSVSPRIPGRRVVRACWDAPLHCRPCASIR